MTQTIQTLSYLKMALQKHLQPGMHCLDATAGRGNDTAFLAEAVGDTGSVTAFDIQPMALAATELLLKQKGIFNRVNLIQSGHEHLQDYIKEETMDAIMFNLGYLPGGDHQIATKAETTLQALEQALRILKPGGMMTVAVYHGGDSGFAERDAVLEYLRTIDHHEYTVMLTDFYNRPNHPPLAVIILREPRK